MKNRISISLLYGAFASMIAIAIDMVLKFTKAHLFAASRYGLYFLTITLLGICIYFAIKKYRKANFDGKVFLLQHGVSIGVLTSLFYAVCFSLYLFILSQTVMPDMFEKYKEQQIALIENSTVNETEKNTQIISIRNMSNEGILLGDFIQRLIFPLTLSLFIAIFMQQKKTIEPIEKQQNIE